MAEIFPFRALRYGVGERIQDMVTEPYDKITPEMQERYYQRSPHSLARIILGRPEPNDGARSNVYTRAAGYFRQWRDEGILQQEGEPGVYAYAQRFKILGRVHERRGLIALGRLHDYGDGVVFRHEQTLTKPKADRLQLLRATRAQFGQIFMLYSDPERTADALIDQAIGGGSPEMEFEDEFEVGHRLWKIAAPGAIAALQQAMREKQLIIADGHHRYETALAYRDERRAEAGGIGLCNPWEKAMMTFINVESPGLVILPTHRVVRGAAQKLVDGLSRTVTEFFEVRELPSVRGGGLTEALGQLRSAGEKNNAILMLTRDRCRLLVARRNSAAERALSELLPGQRKLDVVLLHKLVLEKLLGLSAVSIQQEQNISYFRSAEEAVAQLGSGGAEQNAPGETSSAQVAFLLNPVSVATVREMALAGELMPQKSTDFYPKLLSGLTMYAMD